MIIIIIITVTGCHLCMRVSNVSPRLGILNIERIRNLNNTHSYLQIRDLLLSILIF